MSATNSNTRVQKHRDALRAAGLRPIQLWVPDTRAPGFEDECTRQCLLAAKADAADPAIKQLMDESVGSMEGWE